MKSLFLMGGCRLDDGEHITAEPTRQQIKRVAILAYLSLATEGSASRARIAALFWPEMSEDDARHGLRQALYALRRQLSPTTIVGDSAFLSVNRAELWCDAIAFDEAASAGRLREAVDLYRGDLLDGIHVLGGAAELDEWMELQRTRRRHVAVDCALKLAAECSGQERESLVRWVEELMPLDEGILRQRVSLLASGGNRAAALEAFERFRARLQSQLGVAPSLESEALAGQLRRSSPVEVPITESPARLPSEARSVSPERTAPLAPARPQRASYRLSAGIGGLLAVASMFYVFLRDTPNAPRQLGATLVDQGIRAYCSEQFEGAASLFNAVAEGDSSQAIAAYYSSLVARQQQRTAASRSALKRAVALAATAPAEERLLIQAAWAEARNDTSWRTISEQAFTEFPSSRAAAVNLSRALLWDGDFARARHVLAPFLGVRRATDDGRMSPPCEPSVFEYAARAALLQDSLGVAEALLRHWVAADSSSRQARNWLGEVLLRQNRFAEALAAKQASLVAHVRAEDDAFVRAITAIRAVDLTTAERLLRDKTRDARRDVRVEANWWLAIVLREQGRMPEALTAARTHSELAKAGADGSVASLRTLEAQILSESGDLRHAVALFDTIAAAPAADFEAELARPNGLQGRRLSWALAHVAAVVAQQHDTTRLRRLADSLAMFGGTSAFGRDRRLVHHTLGELAIARGSTALAIEEFQRALYSPTDGYSRTNLRLGRVLIDGGRAAEAVAILSAALRGDLEGSNLFVTRSELHEALGEAYLKIGDLQAAREELQLVARAWEHGDPAFRRRAERALQLTTCPGCSRRVADSP